jgi:DNA-binding MarR family transcriptional regulator
MSGGNVVTDADLLAAWHRVRTGAARAQLRIDRALEDAGVPAQWFPVLHLLLGADDHRLPMSMLARDSAMTSGGFTKLADRMAREGLIDRRGSDVDRRVVHASLTADGLALAQRVSAVYAAALRAEVLGAVSPEDLAVAAQVLGRLQVAVPAEVPTDPPTQTPADAPAAAEDGAGADPGTQAAGKAPRTARDPALPDRRGRGRERE